MGNVLKLTNQGRDFSTEISELAAQQAALLAKKTDVPYSYNLGAGLAGWRAKYAAMNDILDINCIGDSIVEGAEASPSYRNNGFVGLLRTHFNAINDVGGGFVPPYHDYDTKLMTFSGVWTDEVYGITGKSKKTSAVDAYTEFTINAPGCEVFYQKGNAAGNVRIDVDGVEYATINTYNADFIYVATASVSGLTNAAHTIRLTRLTGTIFISGFREVKGTKGVRFNMCARYGTVLSDAIVTGSVNMINYLAPDLTIIAYLANDAFTQTTLANYVSRLQTLITNAKVTGDVLLLANGIQNPAATPIPETTYALTLAALAAKNNCGFLDSNKAFGGIGAVATATGFLAGNVHPGNQGHQLTYELLLSAIT